VGLTSRHLAYVIYTSGSTGMPKGVMVEHRGVCNYLNWTCEHYRPTQGSIVSSSLSFDATVTSLYSPLLCGGTVRLLPEEREIDELNRQVALHPDCGLVKITPSHLEALGKHSVFQNTPTSVGLFVIGGEALSSSIVLRWRRIHPEIRLVNEYGPTETVVGCVVYDILEDFGERDSIPIGRPISNTRIYILDGHGSPVPIGVTGELYIGGAGVARGYLNRPELTAERFLADPFADDAGGRMYRTGDLGRWLADGTIEFLGRNDHQVKIRGFRIELGEIEARLCAHGGVREAVVVAREDHPGEKRLVAYYAGDADIGAEALRAHLGSALPDYMVPSAYVRLERLPLTPNGKLDRGALPAPEGEAYARGGWEAPRGAAEEMLAELWSDLLGVDRIGRHDNFFELGGHSLLAVTLIERMRRQGLQVDVRTLFASPTPAGIAAAAEAGTGVVVPANLIPEACRRITPDMLPLIELGQGEIDGIVGTVPGGAVNVQDIYPLAPLQEGILFHHLLAAQGDAYVLPSLLAFDSRERLEGFVAALTDSLTAKSE